MEKVILQSTIDFVLSKENKASQNTDKHLMFDEILRYVKFLQQPLTLGMFVPCDLEGNVLEEPIPFDCTAFEYSIWCKAKERVLFKGFECVFYDRDKVFELSYNGLYIYYEFEDDFFISDSLSNDEVLISIRCLLDMIEKNNIDIELTESAIKQLGL